MTLEDIKNKYGVEVELPSVSGISPLVKSQGYLIKARVSYSHKLGFYINTSGIWLNASEARQYSKELLYAADIVEALNKIYVAK